MNTTKEQAIRYIKQIIATLDWSEPSANDYYDDLKYALEQIEQGHDPEKVLENI